MAARPTTVLIAEDDPVFRRVMGFSISKSGLSVESVGDGHSAYERLQQGGIDFLVTDHQMPICSGLELLEKIDQDPNLVTPPTILCTAKGLELDSIGIKTRYRLVAVMNKPFSPRKLCDLIIKHLEPSDSQPSIESRPIVNVGDCLDGVRSSANVGVAGDG